MDEKQIADITSKIPSWVEPNELELLSQLATEVKPNGVIVEIGALYGGATAILALSNPNAKIISIDNFSWTPDGYPQASAQLFLDNMKSIGAHNVTVIEKKSKDASKRWLKHIDLLWIDGGHDFKSVYFDLFTFSEFAEVIALHDYDNPFWKDIRMAIEQFLKIDDAWYLDKTVGMVAVLRRNK